MLRRTFEWYRVVNPSPPSQVIDNREAAAHDIMTAIAEAEDWELALDCACGAVAGFEASFTQDAEVVKSLVGAVRAHDSSFPEDLTENALELRVCASLALGEMLATKASEAVAVGSVLRSGLGVRPAPAGRFLRQMVDELTSVATRALSDEAEARRQRSTGIGGALRALAEPSDHEAEWNDLVPAIKATFDELGKQAAMDREEINILWWMFAGTSTTGEQFAKMPVGAAALCCGAELGSLCLLPPTSSHEAMLRRAYETGRQKDELTKKTLESIAADWTSPMQTALVPEEADRDLAMNHPALFPLSWLCGRLLASKGSKGWAAEFKRATEIPARCSRSSVDWAIQGFRERTALRTLGTM